MRETRPVQPKNLRMVGTAVIAVLIFGLLFWNYFHGGVPSHHILDQENLPSISNWWSGLLLPVLAWILLGRIARRAERSDSPGGPASAGTGKILLRFGIGLAFGIALSVSFVNQYKPFLDNVLYLLLILAVFVPVFYAEFMLAFVLGMTYTFGAVLPTMFILIVAAAGFLLYRYVRMPLLKLMNKPDRNSTKMPDR